MDGPMRLPATPDAPGRARAALAERCALSPPPALDVALLLTSELVTNALIHAEGVISVSIDCDHQAITVAVANDSPHEPMPAPQDLDAEGGRGLALVAALAHSWGVQQARDGGKAVWFRASGDAWGRFPPPPREAHPPRTVE